MAAMRKKNKLMLRKIMVTSVALLLVAGLVFSAVFGFADYFMSGDNRGMPMPAQEEDYLSALEGMAASMEDALAASPDDDQLKLQLGDIYLEMAMVHGSQGATEAVDRYALKGEALLQDVMHESPAQAGLMLKLALLAAFYQEEDARADEYFQSALELAEDNGEAHLYYGMFLSLRGRDAEAQAHMERVLELEPEGSYLAEMARLSLAGFGDDGE